MSKYARGKSDRAFGVHGDRIDPSSIFIWPQYSTYFYIKAAIELRVK
jgi:hypothetical protein